MDERISLFLELISRDDNMYYWRYDDRRELVESNCPTESILDSILRQGGFLAQAYEMPGNTPLVLVSDWDLIWVAVRKAEEKRIVAVHILGPYFSNKWSQQDIDKLILQVKGNPSSEWLKAFANALHGLPTVPQLYYCQYATMLHYLVNNERISVSDILYNDEYHVVPPDFSNLSVHTPPKDRTNVYRAERAMMEALREGDMQYENAMERAASTAGIRQYTNDPLLNVKIACTTFAAICVRTAIEGGLSITLSYCLGDAYIKSLFLAKTRAEVSDIKNQMYKDFVTRVHNCRTNPAYSMMVQSCCDYINLHLSQQLNIDVLANHLGYAKYYLSTRFKKETGCSVNDYIKIARIERAKSLLATTKTSIDDIAQQVGFVSRGFFSNTFKRCVGISPAAYRKEQIGM